MKVDWLEHAMLRREAEFSSYRNIKVFVLSWNIDACKPTDMQDDSTNIDFLNNAIESSMTHAASTEVPPEIIVFTFQEVIDLEDKKLTASASCILLLIPEKRIFDAKQQNRCSSGRRR